MTQVAYKLPTLSTINPSNLFTENNIIAVFATLRRVPRSYIIRNFLNSLLEGKDLPTQWDEFYFYHSEPTDNYIDKFKYALLDDVRNIHIDHTFSKDLFEHIYNYAMRYAN